jgi:hypothetical protein
MKPASGRNIETPAHFHAVNKTLPAFPYGDNTSPAHGTPVKNDCLKGPTNDF